MRCMLTTVHPLALVGVLFSGKHYKISKLYLYSKVCSPSGTHHLPSILLCPIPYLSRAWITRLHLDWCDASSDI